MLYADQKITETLLRPPYDIFKTKAGSKLALQSTGYCSTDYSVSIDAENDFILSFNILAKLRKEFKNKINFKTDSNFKESTPDEIRKHEEQIAGLLGSLNNYSNPFHGAAWNMATGAKIPGNIINELLSAGKYATERVEQLTKKRLLSREVIHNDLHTK